jgi:hypothetical protein
MDEGIGDQILPDSKNCAMHLRWREHIPVTAFLVGDVLFTITWGETQSAAEAKPAISTSGTEAATYVRLLVYVSLL